MGFDWGVASGDPSGDSIIIWTRISPPAEGGPVHVSYVVSTADEPDRHGKVTTWSDLDWTVKAEVKGLSVGKIYTYAFSCPGASPVSGQTWIPLRDQTKLQLLIANCSQLRGGAKEPNAYSALGTAGCTPDLVVSIGDYIYDTDNAIALSEQNVAYYRGLYANFRSKSQVQKAHAYGPWLAVWDDHDIKDECFSGGVSTCWPPHWGDVKAAALQAFYEWMPMRVPPSGRLEDGWRVLEFGPLATLVMVETRLSARTKQIDEGDQTDWLKYRHDHSVLIGDRQFAEIAAALQNPNPRWRIIANEVIIADRPDPPQQNDDTWSGYPGAREKLLRLLGDCPAYPIVFSGDLHTAWSANLPHPDIPGVFSALEFGAPPISSDTSGTRWPSMQWQSDLNGYLLATFTMEQLTVEFRQMDAAPPFSSPPSPAMAYTLRPGETVPKGG